MHKSRSQLLPRNFVGRSLFIVVALICLPVACLAIPVADYHKNLQRAITALDTLAQTDEEESLDNYQRRLHETVAAVRMVLPENESVQFGNESCNVDNAWLHKELEAFEKVDESEQAHKIGQIIDQLKAIEERVAETLNPGRPAASKMDSKEKLTSILARAEYGSKAREGSAITRLLRDFFRWIQSLFPKRAPLAPGGSSSLVTIAQVVVVVLALAVILYVIKLLIPLLKRTRKKKTRKVKQARIVLGERVNPEDSAMDLLSEAEALARAGELRAAIRKAYIALLVELGDRKLISLAQHKTNRDYLRAVSNIPLLHSKMSGLTDSFEQHWYGFAEATQGDWQDFRANYHAALQTRS